MQECFPRASLWLSTSLVTGSIFETQKQQPLYDLLRHTINYRFHIESLSNLYTVEMSAVGLQSRHYVSKTYNHKILCKVQTLTPAMTD